MNYLSILIATITQFSIGAIWYTPVFGRIWGRIHGFDRVDPLSRKQMQRQMLPLLVVQFLITVITTVVLSLVIRHLPLGLNGYMAAAFIWIGFIVPTQVSAVLFGGTKLEWIVPKILIMAGASILCLEAAAAILIHIA